MSMIAVEGRTEARRTSASGARARRPRDLSRAAVGSGVVIAVRTAPPLDPPFEDEQQPPVSMELLPFDWSEADVERRQISPPKRRLPRPPQDDGSVPQPRSTPTVTARAALQRYIGMCVEVLNGYRPAAHLRPATDAQRFGDVADQLVRRTVRVRMSPGQAARHGRLVRVRRLLICEPLDGVAEAAVVLEQGETCWAMAVRMERDIEEPCEDGPLAVSDLSRRRAGIWRCTVVQVI